MLEILSVWKIQKPVELKIKSLPFKPWHYFLSVSLASTKNASTI
jgi:hypothetical protein